MSEARSGTRSQEHTIEIDAPAEAVWRAITEAEEVVRWYVQEAEIDPREGGIYRVSWGEGMEGVSEITAFEPGRRLRIEHVPTEGSPEGSPELAPGAIAEEYSLETGRGRTVLRLVTSGIPDTEDWDWFYEGTKRGWRIFLMGLRHYLERHPGTPRDHIVSMASLPGSCEEAWPVLMGPEGLGLAGALEEAGDGDRYEAATGFGDTLSGEVLLHDPPFRLLATVEGMNDALLGATLEQMGSDNFLYLSLSTFGLDAGTVEAMRRRWTEWLAGLFPEKGAPGEAFDEMMTDLSAETTG